MPKKRCAGILIKVKDECLLCKRNAKNGEFSLPSGKIENDESAADAAYREFYEETHIDIKKEIEFVGIINRNSRDGKEKRGILYVFVSEEPNKLYPDLSKAEDKNENTECNYFKMDLLPTLISKDLKELLRKILTGK